MDRGWRAEGRQQEEGVVSGAARGPSRGVEGHWSPTFRFKWGAADPVLMLGDCGGAEEVLGGSLT